VALFPPMAASAESLAACVAPVASDLRARAQARLDRKTKPVGSLGRLEVVACDWCAAIGTLAPNSPRKAVVVMAGDHGVATEGVSAYPRAVTRQMLANFAVGGAAINVLARQVGARLVVVDMGVEGEPTPGVLDRRVASGTANLARGPAMSLAQARTAIAHGAELARDLVAEGVGLIGIGEMGIGNTTSASALVALLTGAAPTEVVGRGTGVDDAGLARKQEVVARAVRLHAAAREKPLEALASVGGFEIAGLVGVALAAAANRVPVLVDGFISGAAALVAARLAPAVRGYLIASHRSAERGHAVVLERLGLAPLFDLDLRLGEGSGAALAMPLVDAALALYRDMATFESAGVADKVS
jgi:nicotinate-nucleotide--dimethylbenzimidazole phosphoribosyltransferase